MVENHWREEDIPMFTNLTYPVVSGTRERQRILVGPDLKYRRGQTIEDDAGDIFWDQGGSKLAHVFSRNGSQLLIILLKT